VGCILYATVTDYKPDEKITLREAHEGPEIEQTVLSAMIWNIGFAGLGAEMDFFYDDGQRVRPTKAWHQNYISEIDDYLQRNKGTDFMLLQEVDENSKRSYKSNQKNRLIESTNYAFQDYAYNYKVKYIPMPLNEPMGHVNSGLLSMSNYESKESTRYQFPGSYSWPSRLFFLRRCFLEQRYNLKDQDGDLVIINTHNSAYDDGSLKKAEMDYMKSYLQAQYDAGHFVLVGGDWNQVPSAIEGETKIPEDFLPDWNWAYGENAPTNRTVEKPYDGTNSQRIIDFFLLSPNLDVVNVETINLDFQWSDHQPVFIDFSIGPYVEANQIVESHH